MSLLGPAVIAACGNGYRTIALSLTSTNSDLVNYRDLNQRNATPLIVAASNGHLDIVSALMESGAELNLQVPVNYLYSVMDSQYSRCSAG